MESLTGIDSRGTDFFVADQRGYGIIYQKVTDEFKDKILLNKIVKSIFYSRHGVRVTTSKDETFTADHCCLLAGKWKR